MTSDNTAVPLLEPIPPMETRTSMAIVFIGQRASWGMDGHYVTVISHSEEANTVHVLDSLPSFTQNSVYLPRLHMFCACTNVSNYRSVGLSTWGTLPKPGQL